MELGLTKTTVKVQKELTPEQSEMNPLEIRLYEGKIQRQMAKGLTREQAERKVKSAGNSRERAKERKHEKKVVELKAQMKKEMNQTPEQRAAEKEIRDRKADIGYKINLANEFYDPRKRAEGFSYIEYASEKLTGFPQQVALTVVKYRNMSPKQQNVIENGCIEQNIELY